MRKIVLKITLWRIWVDMRVYFKVLRLLLLVVPVAFGSLIL